MLRQNLVLDYIIELSQRILVAWFLLHSIYQRLISRVVLRLRGNIYLSVVPIPTQNLFDLWLRVDGDAWDHIWLVLFQRLENLREVFIIYFQLLLYLPRKVDWGLRPETRIIFFWLTVQDDAHVSPAVLLLLLDVSLSSDTMDNLGIPTVDDWLLLLFGS